MHLRFGNMRRAEFHGFLGATWPQIESLIPANKLVCVYVDHLEAFAQAGGHPQIAQTGKKAVGLSTMTLGAQAFMTFPLFMVK